MFFQVNFHEEKGDKFRMSHTTEAGSAEDAFDEVEELFPGCEVLTAIPIFNGRYCPSGNCEE
jgi:hypothetical protein